MKGRLHQLRITEDKQYLTVELDGDFRDTFDELNQCDVNIEVKKYRKKRSRDQNAYCWELIDQLATKLGVPRIEIYRECIRNIGGVSEIVCVKTEAVDKLVTNWHNLGIGWITDAFPNAAEGFTNVILYYGSSTYDTKQMTALIDLIREECRENGIETATPEELARMEEMAERYGGN